MNNNLKEVALRKLNERGVTITKIAEITYEIQKKYSDYTIEDYERVILEILEKREVTHAVLTGIAIDEAAEKNLFDPEINDIINRDASLYGIDEILVLSILNIYGSIALTNFGFVDKEKTGIIRELDERGHNNPNECHTFLDDIVGALAAAAASKSAHERHEK